MTIEYKKIQNKIRKMKSLRTLLEYAIMMKLKISV